MAGYTAAYEVKVEFVNDSGDPFATICTVDVDEKVYGANPIPEVIAEAIKVTAKLGTFVAATLLGRIDKTPQVALVKSYDDMSGNFAVASW